MKLTDIPYYVEFVFTSSAGGCMATADHDMFRFIKQDKSDYPITRLEVGDTIKFEPENNRFIVTDIIIRHLHSDTDHVTLGFDSESCSEVQGDSKVWLFTILVKMDPAA